MQDIYKRAWNYIDRRKPLQLQSIRKEIAYLGQNYLPLYKEKLD